MRLIELNPYTTKKGLFIHSFNEVCSDLVGLGALLPIGTTVYLDQVLEDGTAIFHIPNHVTEKGNPCYIKVWEEYYDELIGEVDDET